MEGAVSTGHLRSGKIAQEHVFVCARIQVYVITDASARVTLDLPDRRVQCKCVEGVEGEFIYLYTFTS